MWRGSKEDVPHRQGGVEGTAFPPQGPGATCRQPNILNPLHTHAGTHPSTQQSSQGVDLSRKGSDNYRWSLFDSFSKVATGYVDRITSSHLFHFMLNNFLTLKVFIPTWTPLVIDLKYPSCVSLLCLCCSCVIIMSRAEQRSCPRPCPSQQLTSISTPVVGKQALIWSGKLRLPNPGLSTWAAR